MKTIDEMIAVMTAYKDGKIIEGKAIDETLWSIVLYPRWDWNTADYRVKAEPKYRPYKDMKEFLKAQNEHGMYLYFTTNLAFKLATGINKESIAILWDSTKVEEIEYADLFIRATWQDGSPCGVLEE